MAGNSLSHRRRNARRPPICKKAPARDQFTPPYNWVDCYCLFRWTDPISGRPALDNITIAMWPKDPADANHFYETVLLGATYTRGDVWIDPASNTFTMQLHNWDAVNDHGTASFPATTCPPPYTTIPVAADAFTPPAFQADAQFSAFK